MNARVFDLWTEHMFCPYIVGINCCHYFKHIYWYLLIALYSQFYILKPERMSKEHISKHLFYLQIPFSYLIDAVERYEIDSNHSVMENK